MVTLVPAAGVNAVVRWTQYVSPTGARYWCTIVWPAPSVRATALSKSLPTPNTQELSRVVTSVAVGAPLERLAAAVAPIAPAPLTPEVSTFAKLTTVSIDETGCESEAVTIAFVSRAGANARQISLVPRCTFVRPTSVQLRPAPVT